jgi:signal transduction histidine kinase
MTIESELEWALTSAQDVQRKIRATIHYMRPVEPNAQQFEQDLRIYAADVLQAAELDISFDTGVNLTYCHHLLGVVCIAFVRNH